MGPAKNDHSKHGFTNLAAFRNIRGSHLIGCFYEYPLMTSFVSGQKFVVLLMRIEQSGLTSTAHILKLFFFKEKLDIKQLGAHQWRILL